MSEAKAVELGFVEKAECPEELTSPYFPSKVGGKPAWLNPTHLPTPEETACSVCGAPRTFLLQMYAPLPGIVGAFHRSFFLFMCCNPSCHQHNSARGFRVFRCQLARKNAFYEEEEEGSSDGESDCSKDESAGETIPASDIDDTRDDFLPATDAGTETEPTIDESLGDMCLSDQKQDATDTTSPLCVVCGSAGPKKCSRCRTVHYCSKHHQTHDWRNGHKLFCSDLTSGKCKQSDVTYDPSYGVCLPEFILVTEEEPSVVVEGEGGERAEEERMRDYHKFIQSGKYHDHSSSGKGGRQQQVQKVMEKKAESGTKSDKEFNAFRRRVALEPEQVIRYQRGGPPLLVSRDSAPQNVPPCTCGAPRQFEFQVMPQLLYYLKLDAVSEASVDWGTVYIYSCSASCAGSTSCSYMTEFVSKQDIGAVKK